MLWVASARRVLRCRVDAINCCSCRGHLSDTHFATIRQTQYRASLGLTKGLNHRVISLSLSRGSSLQKQAGLPGPGKSIRLQESTA